MWCFLCDRPARYKMPVVDLSDHTVYADERVHEAYTLNVCEDCARRVRIVEWDRVGGEHIVYMRSLT